MTTMGISGFDNVMKDFGLSIWGKTVELPSAKFKYRVAAGNVVIDGTSFRFTAENWIYPNRERYRRNQSVGTMWFIYDQIQINKDLSDKHRKWLNDFMDELNEYITGSHTQLHVTFVFGQNIVMRYGEHVANWLYLVITVPHTPQPKRESLAPRIV